MSFRQRGKVICRTLLESMIILLNKQFRRCKVYPSYLAALGGGKGYEDEDLVKVIVESQLKINNDMVVGSAINMLSLHVILPLIGLNISRKIKILEYGGGAGEAYRLAKAMLGKTVKLDWRIVETPAMVALAVDRGLSNTELQFFDSLSLAADDEKFDVVLSNGAIQYSPRPYELLAQLARIKADRLIITRIPLTEAEVILRQRSYLSTNINGSISHDLGIRDRAVFYPVTMLDREKVEKELREFGTHIQHLTDYKGAYRTRYESYDMYGYIVNR